MLDVVRATVSPLGELVPLERVRRSNWAVGRGVLLRLANDRLRRRPRSFDVVDTEVGRIVGGDTRDLIERYLYVFGTWEPALSSLFRAVLRRGDVFVDIGANVGYFSLLASQVIGESGHVVAFEPHPRTVEKLRRNVDANDRRNVTIVPFIASDEAGEAEMFSGPATNLGRSSTSPIVGGSSTGRVRTVVASEAIPLELWPRVRAIKVDVEGDELRVLHGLRPLLERLTPGACVVAEVAPARLEERGSSAEELLDLMAGLGFEAAALQNEYDPAFYARPVVSPPKPLAGAPDEIVDVVWTKRPVSG